MPPAGKPLIRATPEISYRGNRRNRRKNAKLLTADGADIADYSNKTICESLRNLRLMDWKEIVAKMNDSDRYQHTVAETAKAFVRKSIETLGAFRYKVKSIAPGCEIFELMAC